MSDASEHHDTRPARTSQRPAGDGAKRSATGALRMAPAAAHLPARTREADESAARRRAQNAVWNAAGDYEIKASDLAFSGDRTVDLYRNTARGLIVKHYGGALDDLERSWHEDYRADALDDVAWLAFEAAAFAAETADRPALAALRDGFLASLSSDERAIARAVAPAAGPATAPAEPDPATAPAKPGAADAAPGSADLEPGPADAAPDRGDAGSESADTGSDRAKAAPAPEPADAVEARIRRELRERYRFDGTVVKAPQASLHLGLSLLGLSMRDRRSRDGAVSAPADAPLRAQTGRGRLRQAIAEHADERRRTRAARDRAYIQARFGASLCTPAELERLERDLCVGAHEGCHLWVADGAAEAVPDPDPQLSALARAADEQHRANRAFYEANRRAFEAASRRLAQNLGDRLRSASTFTEKRRTRGRIEAEHAWRLALLDDDHVFSRRVPADDPGVAVDLLLDASGSRADACAAVAAQAYIVGKSLASCGIDVRIWAFSSMRGYTVLRLFNRSSSDAELAHAFRYTASGMNRDGLALRCVGALAPARATDRRLVLMLTDAAPMDDVGMVQTDGDGTRSTVDYNGRAAVRDTAQIVRDLRSSGIAVCALFDGEDTFLENARLMFGSDFMRVRRIDRMADRCAALVANALETGAR